MPELPEVETVVRGLRHAGLVGLTIERAHVLWHRTVAPMPPPDFARRLQGQQCLSVNRRAKYIVCSLDSGDALLIHLRMTGQLRILPPDAPLDPHDRLLLDLSDGRRLHFRDARKFGRCTLATFDPITDDDSGVDGGCGGGVGRAP